MLACVYVIMVVWETHSTLLNGKNEFLETLQMFSLHVFVFKSKAVHQMSFF